MKLLSIFMAMAIAVEAVSVPSTSAQVPTYCDYRGERDAMLGGSMLAFVGAGAATASILFFMSGAENRDDGLVGGGFAALGIGAGLIAAGVLVILYRPGPHCVGGTGTASVELSEEDDQVVDELRPELARRLEQMAEVQGSERRRQARELEAWLLDSLEGRISEEGIMRLQELAHEYRRVASARTIRTDGMDLSADLPVYIHGSGVGLRF